MASQAQSSASSSQKSAPAPLAQFALDSAVYSNTPFTEAETSLIKARDIASLQRPASADRLAALAATAAPCKLMILLSTGISCWLPIEGVYSVGQLAIGPEIPGCTTIPTGVQSTGLTAPAGGLSCYQFIASTADPLSTQIALPSGISGIAELYAVAPNGAGMKISDDLGRGNPMTVTSAHGNMRLALMVRPEAGAGGQEFKIGVGVPVTQQVNDSPETATVVAMNQTVSGTIPVPGVSARYYFYPLRVGQSAAVVFSGTTTNQAASYQRAQKTGLNTYVLGPEVSPGTYDYPSSLPLNTADTTSPYGIMLKVSGVSSSAPSNEPFTLRVGIRDAFNSAQTPWNNEGLNKIYQVASGLIQGFRYIGLTIVVKDEAGNVIPGERVKIKVTPNERDESVFQLYDLITDATGTALLKAPLPACVGVDFDQENIQFSVPREYWKMDGQKGVVISELPDATPPARFASRKIVRTDFYQICRQTFDRRE